jgi:hypothetical protein
MSFLSLSEFLVLAVHMLECLRLRYIDLESEEACRAVTEAELQTLDLDHCELGTIIRGWPLCLTSESSPVYSSPKNSPSALSLDNRSASTRFQLRQERSLFPQSFLSVPFRPLTTVKHI